MAEDVFDIVGTTQAGSFHVEKVVAEGGFSVVYRAQHGAFRAPVALKCLKVPGVMSGERDLYLEKFREEAEMLFRLSASIPEVVRPLHVDTLTLRDGQFVPFLALEWLEGQTLDEIIWRRKEDGQAPMGIFKVMKLLSPIARALSRAHRFPGPKGPVSIIHRDIKPENIVVGQLHGQEVIKILDFGIAMAVEAAERRAGRTIRPSTVETAFTPRYGSPEQWEPEEFGSTGTWTDVWGLALTMVDALSGNFAVDGDPAMMRRIILDTKRRPTPRAKGVVIADEPEKAFIRALAVNPKERTQEIETFWRELEVALGIPSAFKKRDVRQDAGMTVQPTEENTAPVRAEAPPPAKGTPIGAIKLRRSIPGEPQSSDQGSPPTPGRVSEPGAPPARAPAGGPGSREEEYFGELGMFEDARPPVSGAGMEMALPSSPAPAIAADPPLAGTEFDLPEGPDPVAELGASLSLAPSGPPITSPSATAPPAGDQFHLTLPAIESKPRKMPSEAPPESEPLGAGKGGYTAGNWGKEPTATVPIEIDIDAPSTLRNSGEMEAVRPSRVEPWGAPSGRASTFNARPVMPERPERPVLRLPITMMGIGLAVVVADLIAGTIMGQAIKLGPVRPMWLGVILVALGTALLFWRLLGDNDD
jgi:eukaryotic-like serine/threonine-protein kinase